MTQKSQTKPDLAPRKADRDSTIRGVMRAPNEDQRKVAQILAEAETDTKLQKDIRWKTGLSLAQTRRVLSRLAKRGIISMERYYRSKAVWRKAPRLDRRSATLRWRRLS